MSNMPGPMRFAFIDVDTQKDYVEHFGAAAIPDCPEIRENLMELMSFAIRNGIKVFSPVYTAKGETGVSAEMNVPCQADSPGWHKVLDTECESRLMVENVLNDDEIERYQQFLFPHPDPSPLSHNGFLQSLAIDNPTHLLIFGVPLQSAVRDLVIGLAEGTDYKIWLVRDVVKAHDETETEGILNELKALDGVSLMTARNVLKFLSEVAYGKNFEESS